MKWLILERIFYMLKQLFRLLKKYSTSNSEYVQSWEQWNINTSNSNASGIKTLSVLENVSLVNLEGRGLLGKNGVDARISGWWETMILV
jgi:hypothetical protein